MRLLGSAVALVMLLLPACGGEEELSGFVRSPLPEVGHLTLPDVSTGDSEFAMRAADGHVLLVYFGYTSCPDVCPTTMADIRGALGELGDAAASIDVAMATVDPDRDTPDVLTGYVRSFVPDGHALRTTDDEQLQRAAETLGAAYDVGVADDGTYEVVHTGHLYAIDDGGLLRVTWPFGIERSDLVRDLEILLDGA